jgi:hypothetical protein
MDRRRVLLASLGGSTDYTGGAGKFSKRRIEHVGAIVEYPHPRSMKARAK